MNEFDTPNYTEYTYEKRAYGKNLLARCLLIALYVVFVIGFFLVCYLTRLIPLFALSVVFTWMLVFFTWRYVSYDCFFTFNAGNLTLGTIHGTKRGKLRKERLNIHVKEAQLIVPLSANEDKLVGIKKLHDFSSTDKSDKRILILFYKDSSLEGAIFEGTARIAKLLCSFCPNAAELKDKVFHG